MYAVNGGAADPDVAPMRMKTHWRTVAVLTVVVLVVIAVVVLGVRELRRTGSIQLLTGAIIVQHDDPLLQRPIANATITAVSGESGGKAASQSSGLFRLRIEPPIAKGDIVQMTVQHPDYEPFVTTLEAADAIHVVRLAPKPRPDDQMPQQQVRISNVRVRYATRLTTTSIVGTAVRTFDVANNGDVACVDGPPCSPDGKWKATIGSLSLDAGDDRHFRNVRVSCIAGPCPFSAIESDQFSKGGRKISVSVRNWSDKVTYLLEAEVVQTMQSDLIRHTYPSTFGRFMNFTLPPGATGPSIEADVDGSQIVFPLGPELRLSWASCRLETGQDGTKLYRCELKPGFRFD